MMNNQGLLPQRGSNFNNNQIQNSQNPQQYSQPQNQQYSQPQNSVLDFFN